MTQLAYRMDMRDDVRGLLELLDGYPNREENMGFQPSLLRYKVRPSEQVSNKKGYEPLSSSDGSLVSKVMSVNSVKTWYEDDDWIGKPPEIKKRLGESTDLEPIDRKLRIQEKMLEWCKKANISTHVDAAIGKLSPRSLDPPLRQSGYGVKFDLYTNRVAPAWHQDWDHGHALFVALVNLTKHDDSELSIKGAEILNFTRHARTEGSTLQNVNSQASEQRKQLMSQALYDISELSQFPEDQPFGEIRWFNDAVLVHRTPPYAVNTLSGKAYKLRELNGSVSVGNNSLTMPDDVLQNTHRDKNRYLFNGPAPPAGRSLLRITVRQRRKALNL